MFMNEIFLPGKKVLTVREGNQFPNHKTAAVALADEHRYGDLRHSGGGSG